LRAQLHHVEPDEAISIEYRRDGKLQKVQVTPKSPNELVVIKLRDKLDELSRVKTAPMSFNFDGPIWMDSSTGFGTAELADLSPGLGRYFGTDKGLLVVRAPKDDRLKLQDGDVILDIDGRQPGSPSHAYEILSSYHSGETLKLHVMRQQKKLELPIEIPESGHAGVSRLRAEGFPRFDLIAPRLMGVL
jgi:S1-C subfamily serine protease